MSTSKISVEALAGVAETLLPVLYARVYESRHPQAMFNDPVALAWVERIDYDFAKYDDAVLTNLGVAIRTEILDEYVREYIELHPTATIVNIGAGLDTRFYRMDNGQITWIELDLPESIALRKQLMDETERHYCLAHSALDFAWMNEIPAGDVLFIIEGLLMYFSEEQVQDLLRALAARFPGGEMLVEVMGVTQAKHTERSDAIAKTDASFQWGIRDVTLMAAWHSRISYVSDISIYDRYEARWLATSVKWKEKPATYRNAVDRIVHLRIANTP
ncbi:MAG: class I SAM-dependent methyltransferase [Aggregatilineales bacterium]